MAGATSARPTARAPEKKLLATVTNIADTVDDTFMKELLACCGPVKEWKRPTDPSTKRPKAFGFVEYESAQAMNHALEHLAGQTLDGKELQLKATKPTQQYLAWVVEHGPEEAGDGEPGQDAGPEDEMAVLEAVMDALSRRGGGAGVRSGRGAKEADDLIDSVARQGHGQEQGRNTVEWRERVFADDQDRKDRQRREEREKSRDAYRRVLRDVQKLQERAARDRRDRETRLRDAQRARLEADDGREDSRDENERSMRLNKRLRQEQEADEKDRMAELEEVAASRNAAHGTNSADTATNVAPRAGILDADDGLMKAMLAQAGVGGLSVGGSGADGGHDSDRDRGGGGGGGWQIAGAAPAAAGGSEKKAAVKKHFFDDGGDDGRAGGLAAQQRYLQEREAASSGAAPAASTQQLLRTSSTFESERDELLRSIPTRLDGVEQWPLSLDVLRLDRLESFQRLQGRIANYAKEYIPEDTDDIAKTVLQQVRQDPSARSLVSFCDFFEQDKEQFVLKVFRLLIAEVGIAKLKMKYRVGEHA